MATALDGLRVVDLTDLRGALCARMLADLGADVVRLEPIAERGPDAVASAYRHANKRLAAGADLETLLSGADVLVDNLGPLRRAELDLHPDAVGSRHPRLVHVVMADFGLSGPRAGWRLEPLTAQAAGGTLFASGFPELPPCWFPGFLGHDCASVYGFAAALAALADRDAHGRGQAVEISVQEATLAGTNPWSVAVNDYLKIIPVLPAAGTRNADGFYFVLPAADGWVRFVIGNDKQWRGALALAGDPEVLMAEEWSDPLYRRLNADVARLVLSDALRDRTRAELFDQAGQVGATMGVIHTPREYVAHPQPASRGVFAPGRLPGVEGGPTIRPPLELSVTPGRAGVEPLTSASAEWSGPGPAAVEPAEGSGPVGALPLAGLSVVEFGMAAVGPEAAGLLAEWGADVVKIESRAHLDVLRMAGGGRVNCAFAFNVECRGRRSVTLNLETSEGRRLAFELCRRADVVVENYRGGVLDDLGLGYEAVSAANPSVVYASSQGYGRTGPLARMAAYGPLNLGFAGLHLLWNHPDGPYPCGTSLNHPDHVAGKFLAGGILAALAHRRRSGVGQRVDLAQTELAAYLRGEVYLEAWRLGADPAPMGNASSSACPHGVYPALGDDRWVAVVAADDADWAALCRALGWADLAGPDLATAERRLARAAEIDARLSEWTSARSALAAAEQLQGVGVSAVPVMGPLDHLADPHLLERGFIVELEHPEVGAERHAGNPVRPSRRRLRVLPSAPCLGAHTAEVLGEYLGIGPDEVEALAARGVCY